MTDHLEQIHEDGPEEWREQACGAMDLLAANGSPFDSMTLTELGVPDPHHPGQWGALFRVYSTRGLIEPLGFEYSRRPTRSGGICRTWVGTAKARRKDAA